MSELKEKFLKLKDYSVKWEKYFPIYENYFKKFKDQKIIFVEIGIFNGGSLQMWKEYFGKDSKIIGIDINPECKKFENLDKNIFVEIGNQSDEIFWKNFFNKYGNADIILDDGGHTNLDQIITTVNAVKNINDEGVLMIEDTHTSYQKAFGNPSKFSFINFAKKTIDDINFRFPSLGSFNYSLNKYIHSVQFFESIVCINVNKALCKKNLQIKNNGIKFGNADFRYRNKKNVRLL